MNWKGKIERMDSLRWIVHFFRIDKKMCPDYNEEKIALNKMKC